jgi:hypothetical protein
LNAETLTLLHRALGEASYRVGIALDSKPSRPSRDNKKAAR